MSDASKEIKLLQLYADAIPGRADTESPIVYILDVSLRLMS